MQILNLSNNKIKRVQNLPVSLKELYLTNNQICEFELLRMPLKNLVHIGLAYNSISNEHMPTIARNFPNLFCLDLSYNELCDLGAAITQIEKLAGLKVLYLAGNPLALTYRYREVIKQSF